MKIRIAFIVFAIFISSNGLSAQVDRRLSNQHANAPKKQEKVDYVDLATTKLKSQLELDNFQEAVISQILAETSEKEKKILEEEIPNDAKLQKITELRTALAERIKEILNPDQKIKFEALQKKKK